LKTPRKTGKEIPVLSEPHTPEECGGEVL